MLFVARAVGMEPFMELSRRDRIRFVVCEDNMAVWLGLLLLREQGTTGRVAPGAPTRGDVDSVVVLVV